MRKLDLGFLLIFMSNAIALMVVVVASEDANTLWAALPIMVGALFYSYREYGSIMVEVLALVMLAATIAVGGWVTANPNVAWAFILLAIAAATLYGEEPALTKEEKRIRDMPR